MLKIIVGRERWGYGRWTLGGESALKFDTYDTVEYQDHKWDYYNQDHDCPPVHPRMCCAGFLAETLNEQYDLDTDFYNVSTIQEWVSAHLTRTEAEYLDLDPKWFEDDDPNSIVNSLYKTNDGLTMDQATRELALGHLGEMLGVDFEFVN